MSTLCNNYLVSFDNLISFVCWLQQKGQHIQALSHLWVMESLVYLKTAGSGRLTTMARVISGSNGNILITFQNFKLDHKT